LEKILEKPSSGNLVMVDLDKCLSLVYHLNLKKFFISFILVIADLLSSESSSNEFLYFFPSSKSKFQSAEQLTP